MKNPYSNHHTIITEIKNQSSLVKLFTLRSKDPISIKCSSDDNNFIKCWWPGQFIILSIPGFGEAPFAICSSPSPCSEFQLCVQKKGLLTDKLFSLGAGDTVYFRGPYGNGFPISKMSGRNILLVSGGLGLVPLRPLIQLIGNHPEQFGKIQLFSGSRNERSLLFTEEYKSWQQFMDLNLTIDDHSETWQGNTGNVTVLFDKNLLIKNPVVIICGPPVMYEPVIKKLKKNTVAESDIYVLLERRMQCGIGICQHCVLVGDRYVCKDGPVFNYAEIKDSPGAI